VLEKLKLPGDAEFLEVRIGDEGCLAGE